MGSPGYDIAICLQDPLRHFVPLTTSRAKHSAQDFFVKRESSGLLPVVAPLIPLILTDVRDVSLLIECGSMWIGAMESEGIFGSQVVDACTSFTTVIPEW
jgi:hypothetical protein